MNNSNNKLTLILLIILFGLVLIFSFFLIIEYNNFSKNKTKSNKIQTTINPPDQAFKTEIGTTEKINLSTEEQSSVGYKYTTVIGKLKKAYTENNHYFFIINTLFNNSPLDLTLDLGSSDKSISKEIFKLDDPNNPASGFTQSLEQETVAQMYNANYQKIDSSFKFYITTKPGIENRDDPKCSLYCQNVIDEYEKYKELLNKLVNNSPDILNLAQPLIIGGVYTYTEGDN